MFMLSSERGGAVGLPTFLPAGWEPCNLDRVGGYLELTGKVYV